MNINEQNASDSGLIANALSGINLSDAEDVFTVAEPGTLKRSWVCTERGLYRLSRRDAAVYSVEISSGGAWGRFMILDGNGKPLFFQPSTFTGSFMLCEGCAHNGLYLHSECISGARSDAQISLQWREKDACLI